MSMQVSQNVVPEEPAQKCTYSVEDEAESAKKHPTTISRKSALVKRATAHRAPKSIASDRALFFQTFSESAPRQDECILSELESAAVARQRVEARFFELFYSRTGDICGGFDYFLRYAPTSSTLRRCLDAMTLVHVGNADKDQRLRNAARKAYGNAISALRFELGNPKRNPSTLLASMHLLARCELFSDIAAPDGLGARRHARGIMQMLEHFKPQSLDPAIRELLTVHLNGYATWDAIFERKGLRGLGNLQDSFKNGTTYSSSRDSMDGFVAIAIRVPQVLEHAGVVTRMGSKAPLGMILQSIRDIVAIEGELQQYITHWYEAIDHKLYRIVAASHLPGLPITVDGHEHAFRHAYVFHDPLDASRHWAYWVLLCCLAQGHLKLLEASPGLPILKSSHDETQRLKRMATEHADNTCMAIMPDLQPATSYGVMASDMFPIQIALHWYRRQMDLPKIAWCEQALDHFRAAGLQPPRMSNDSPACSKRLHASSP